MRKLLRYIFATFFGLFLLWLIFKNTNPRELWNAIEKCNPIWFLLCILTIIMSFFTRVFRWNYIVNAEEKISFRHLFTSTQIGFLANFILPGRLGEAVRAGMLTKLTKVPFSKSLTYVVIDRIFDLLGLLIILVFALIGFQPKEDIPLPPEILNITIPADIIRKTTILTLFIFFLFILSAIVFYTYYSKFIEKISLMERFLGEKLTSFIKKIITNIRDATSIIKNARGIILASLFSSLTWGLFWASYVCLLKGYNLSFPWYTPPVCITMLSILISIPGAPGFIGQFHAGILAGLILCLPNIDINVARAIAILGHGGNFITVVAVGIICLLIENRSGRNK
ncbi:MAG: flippase-like domain-containing protein [Candidatus Hydrogenedentes bacterium]|nr:flippase-like domain-containing protein [Candidatus Hydrogenedentota bacterium]